MSSSIEQGSAERLPYDDPVVAGRIVRGLSDKEMAELLPELEELHRRSQLLLEVAVDVAEQREARPDWASTFFIREFQPYRDPLSKIVTEGLFLPQPDHVDTIRRLGLGAFLFEEGDYPASIQE